jgi:hypothetical protein
VPARGRKQIFHVTEGLGDIVRSLWEQVVTVTGYQADGKRWLSDVRLAAPVERPQPFSLFDPDAG